MPRVEIDLAAQSVDPVTSSVSAAVGASVQVFNRNANGTNGSQATVYVDATSGTVALQPLAVDAAGRIQGWVVPGNYNLVVSGPSLDAFTQPWNAGDDSAVKSASIYDSGSGKYPARPLGAVSVEWVGPSTVDPSVVGNIADGVSAAQNNDTWIKTDESAVVHITGTESVTGAKTFTTLVNASDGVATRYLSGAGKTTVVDGDFSVTPVNGTLAVHRDTTANKTYTSVRAAGVWTVIAGPL